jgi:hypothetical protein
MTETQSALFAASGDYSNLAASGNGSNLAASGANSIAAAIGIKSKAITKDKTSWIVICDWRKDNEGNWYIHNAITAKPEKRIGKTTIKINTWYWFENGKLKSEPEK